MTLYLATGQAAAHAGVTASVATAWDARIPFVAWTLVPYMATMPLLVLAFLGAREVAVLRAFSQRCLLITVLATVVFAIWPFRVTHVPPVPADALPALLQRLVHLVDTPYNQVPSLHVASCVILWPALRHRWPTLRGRLLLAAGLLMVALSAVLTWQHHLVDLVAGLGLGMLAIRLTPVHDPARRVAMHHALLSVAAFTLLLVWWPVAQRSGAAAVALGALAWCLCSSALVALAYLRRDRGFLHKRNGTFPWWVWLAYGPYLLGYRLTWWLVGMRTPTATEVVAPGLLVGRRLKPGETSLLPPGCRVIDLAAELPQVPALRACTVHAEPLLDLVPMPADRVAAVVALIERLRADGTPVYVHCAMGLQRSRSVMVAWGARHREASAR